MDYREQIVQGQAVMGLELGSTRIKAVLLGTDHTVLASGSFAWENRLENGVWTYHQDEILPGIQACYADLKKHVMEAYQVKLTKLAALGISSMMHGYLPFDKDGNLLTPFRTWRNTMTGQASEELTALLNFNIPQRWSVAHLYQEILNKEAHVPQIAYLTTLSGYVHWMLSGKKILGIGDASGMFPIDSKTNQFDEEKLQLLQKKLDHEGFGWKLRESLPEVLTAGDYAGTLTAEGAKLLDPEGDLQSGVQMCPPEGDAGTGMVATNAVAARTGNVSAGTSIFGMIVLEKPLSKVYPELDLVTTPSGKPVAMAHCNNCASDLDAWVRLLREATAAFGVQLDTDTVYHTLFQRSLEGAPDCGGLVACNYLSGEHVTHFTEGRPMFARRPNAEFSLANFIRSHLYAAMATLKIGLDILINKEGVKVDRILGHGGLFKTPGVAQRYLAAAIHAPVSVMKTAAEGGPYGMALLASYRVHRLEHDTLEDFLNREVFGRMELLTVSPDPEEEVGFEAYMCGYHGLLKAEKAAVASM